MANNKVALITGSTRGIGLGIAKSLAAQKYNILLNGFATQNQVDEITAELKAFDIEVAYHGADLTAVEEIEAMIEFAEKNFGGVDLLVNNAGLQFVSPIQDFPTEKWDQIIAVILSATFHTTRLVLPSMIQKGWGRIINIASAHAITASPFKAAYVAAKHGVAGLTKTAALEVAQQGITVNAICPGYVWTELVANQVADTAKARGISEDEVINNVILAAQPTKQFVQIDQIAAAVLYLISDAAANINGTNLSMDGGWTS